MSLISELVVSHHQIKRYYTTTDPGVWTLSAITQAMVVPLWRRQLCERGRPPPNPWAIWGWQALVPWKNLHCIPSQDCSSKGWLGEAFSSSSTLKTSWHDTKLFSPLSEFIILVCNWRRWFLRISNSCPSYGASCCGWRLRPGWFALMFLNRGFLGLHCISLHCIELNCIALVCLCTWHPLLWMEALSRLVCFDAF